MKYNIKSIINIIQITTTLIGKQIEAYHQYVHINKIHKSNSKGSPVEAQINSHQKNLFPQITCHQLSKIKKIKKIQNILSHQHTNQPQIKY